MLILGLDFETQGLDPAVHAISEVGAVLWDTEYRRPVQSMQYLVQVPLDSPFEPEAVAKTGLTPELLAKHGKDSLRSLKQLLNMYDQADVICAHNGNKCDRLFLRAWMDAHGITDDVYMEDKLWIDTLTDIEYPKGWNKQLICLAAYYGFINPFPHSALFDTMTMLRILGNAVLEDVILAARTPIIAVRLHGISYDDREWAKARGYFPYRDKDSGKFKCWMKLFKENKFEDELSDAKAAGYDIIRLEEIPEGVY